MHQMTQRVTPDTTPLPVPPAPDSRHLHEELQRLVAELHATQDSRREFFAYVSHELRTPLNAILGFCQMINGQIYGPLDNPRYRSYLEYIQESGEQLLSMVNELLARADDIHRGNAASGHAAPVYASTPAPNDTLTASG